MLYSQSPAAVASSGQGFGSPSFLSALLWRGSNVRGKELDGRHLVDISARYLLLLLSFLFFFSLGMPTGTDRQRKNDTSLQWAAGIDCCELAR